MDEQRLPSPIAGTRTSGDGDPALGRGDAARLLYLVNLIADTAGVPVYGLARQTPYGMVTASVHGPLAFKSIRSDEEVAEEEEPEGPVSRLVWLPEGFVITPRSAAAPAGFGMPPTADGRGTPGGPLREVIINRFMRNQYPDALVSVLGQTQGPGRRVVCAGLFYMDWEAVEGPFGIGVWSDDGTRFTPQFRPGSGYRFTPTFTEADGGAWFCHRPAYSVGADDVFEATVRTHTNSIRAESGQPPLSPPVRGTEGELSAAVLYMVKWSGTLAHGSHNFREGHTQFDDRLRRRAGREGNFGENLSAVPYTQNRFTVASAAVAGWRKSPGHFANMTRDWSSGGTDYASVDAYAMMPVTLRAIQTPPYDLYSPTDPVSPPAMASVASQIFRGSETFVKPAICGSRDIAGQRVGLDIDGGQGHNYTPWQIVTIDRAGQGPAVAFKGRSLLVMDFMAATDVVNVIAAKVMRKNNRDMLRFITIDRAPDSPRMRMSVREGRLEDVANTHVLVSRLELPEDLGAVSTVCFSESGDKAVFSYSVPTPCLDVPRQAPLWFAQSEDNLRNEPYDDEDPYKFYQRYVWGDTLYFIEWKAKGGWTQIDRQSLDIVPEYAYAGGEGDPTGTRSRNTCKGSYKLFADYSGEDLVYATVSVDSTYENKQSMEGLAPGEHAVDRRLRGTMVLPGGKRIVFMDTTMRIHDQDADNGFSGFFLQFLYLDILRPQDAVYVKQTISGGMRQAVRSTLHAGGVDVRSINDVLQHDRDDVMYKNTTGVFPYGDYTSATAQTGLRGYVTSGSFSPSNISFCSLDDSRLIPMRPYKAALVSAGLGDRVKPRGIQLDRAFIYELVGPEIACPIIDGSYAVVARYKSERIVAGDVGATLGPEQNCWVGDDRFFHTSSLDLKAITGIPDLKQNILPIGVL